MMPELNKIYQGDCLEIMREWPTECVDAVITDPPFGIGFKYREREIHNNPQSYCEFMGEFVRAIKRLIRPGGFMAVWQSTKYLRYAWDWFPGDIRIFICAKNFVQVRPAAINWAYDPVVMYYKEGKPLRPQKPPRSFDYYVADTASVVSRPNSIERQHPCPRPLDAVRVIVENFSIGTILDPFFGSGTLGVAAEQLGRKWIGIEIEPKYISIAQSRIDAERAQGKLF